MARMSRTRTDVPDAGGQTVAPKRFSHAVPTITSEMAGVDPFAGDLTNAFNNFFNKANDSLNTIQSANFAVKQEKLKRERALRDQQATNEAAEAVNNGQTMDEAVAGLQHDPNEFPHYITTFKEAYGANMGARIWNDFTLSMENQDPANFEALAEQWREDNIGNGTGDEIVDTHMNAMWSQNYEPARVEAGRAAIANTREDTLLETTRSVFNEMSSGNFGMLELNNLVTRVDSLFPANSQGRNRAIAWGMARDNAIRLGVGPTQNFLRMLREPDAETGQSLADRFPIVSQQLESETIQRMNSMITLDGQTAYAAASNQLESLIATNTDPKALELELARFFPKFAELENTPGITLSQIQQLRSRFSEQVSEVAAFGAGLEGIREGVRSNNWAPSLTQENVSDFAYDYITREFDFINDPSVRVEEKNDGTAELFDPTVEAARTLQGVYFRYGASAFSDEMKGYFTNGLRSTDANVVQRTVAAIRGADPSGTLASELLGHDQFALGVYETIVASNRAPGVVTATVNSPEFQAALQEIGDAGGVAQYQFGTDLTKNEAEAALDDRLTAGNLGEAIEEAMDADGLLNWTSPTLDARVRQAARDAYTFEIALAAADGVALTDEQLDERVATRLAPSLMIVDGVVRMNEGVVGGNIIGRAVPNGVPGEFENTAATLMDDIEQLQDGLPTLQRSIGGPLLEDASLTVRRVNTPDLENDPEFSGMLGVFYEGSGQQVVIPTGVPLNVDEQYDITDDGEASELGWLSDWWRDDTEFTLTGDLEQDMLKLRTVLPPSIRPRPVTVGDTVQYELFITPRFKGGAGVLTPEQIRALAENPNGIQAYNPFQGDQNLDYVMP